MSEEEGEDCYDNVLDLCENVLEIEVGRVELDKVHRVGKPREALDGSERPPPPRAMTVKLKGYGTKIKFIKAHRGLRGKNIYINKDLTKDTHNFLLQIKKDCVEGVAVYIVDGFVLIWPVSRTQERFTVLWRVMTLNVMVWTKRLPIQSSFEARCLFVVVFLHKVKQGRLLRAVSTHKFLLYQRTAHRFNMKASNP